MRKLYTFFALAVLCAAALAVTPEAVVSRGQDESAAGKQAAKGNSCARATRRSPTTTSSSSTSGRPGRGEFSQAARDGRRHDAAYGGKVKHVYKHALNGFAAEMTEDAGARARATTRASPTSRRTA